VAGDSSSQYLSGLLMAAPYAKTPLTIHVTGDLQSKPFVDMTLNLMNDFGVTAERRGYASFTIHPSVYKAQDYLIEGDAMAAGYFWAAAAITGGRVKVTNVGSHSVQGDRRLADVLGQMGCTVSWTENSCEVTGSSGLKGGTFDLNDMPDQAQTLAVVGLFADSPVRIENVWNMRIKETDRLAALNAELTKFGAKVEEGRDYIVIHPLQKAPDRVEVATYGDHRMAMAFALAGLKIPNVTILEPSCVAKTFPEFFEVLEGL
jgi:3-phosphoshikimate 1-carboxyvinyltransferase